MKKESVTAWRRTPRRDMEFRRLRSAPFKTGLYRKKAKQTLIDQVDVYFLGVIYFYTQNDELNLYFINVLLPLAE